MRHGVAGNLTLGFVVVGFALSILIGEPTSTYADDGPTSERTDSDGDGVPDGSDNCPDAYNPDQSDRDGFQIVPVTGELGDPLTIFAADLDGDGDLDLLASSPLDHEVVWYENTDGAVSFGPPIVIATGAESPHIVSAADVDGDGDIDALTGSGWYLGYPDEVAWYENLDGAGNFGPQRLIGTEAATANIGSVQAVDLDGDQDMDILVGGSSIGWYENLDGDGNFGSRIGIANGTSAVAVDVDGDSHVDVVAASSGLRWFRNTGGGSSFVPIGISTNWIRGPVFVADLDGDADADVLVVQDEFVEEVVILQRLAWYENTDGAGSFGPSNPIDLLEINAALGFDVFAIDVEGDGDIDAVSLTRGSGVLAWYENLDGGGVFGPERSFTVPGYLNSHAIFGADVENDGDGDVFLSVPGDDQVVLFRNGDGLGVPCDNCPGEPNATQYDLDGDGAGDVCDCARLDPTVLEPPAVSGVSARHLGGAQWGTVELTWSPAPGADGYSITRGELSGLAIGQYGACLEQGIPVTSYDDSAVPGTGTGYAYLIQGVSSQCGPGTLGYDTGNVERVNQDASGCP